MFRKLIFCWLLLSAVVLSAENLTTEPLFSVSVVGMVKNPGVYHLPPSVRISEAIKQANYQPVAEDNVTKNVDLQTCLLPDASMRKVILKRGKEEFLFDLTAFYTCGDIDQNPYIQDGDIILIKAIENTVSISGAVNRPGEYELVSGDRISDVIELAMGITDDAYLKRVELIRFVEDNISSETIEFSLQKIMADAGSSENLVLRNDDRIFIRKIDEFHEKKSVTVFGEVKFPGIYAIEENKTFLFNALQACGGPTDNADLANSFIQRKSREDVVDPEFERLKIMQVQDMTSLEYEYFKTKSRELRGKFSVNFVDILSGSKATKPILLKNSDYIYFPSKTVTVSVSGQVKNPGLISYEPDKNYMYYIKEAGGFSWNPRKRKIRIIRAATGEWLKPDKETIIEIGDMIFVPEKLEMDYWELTKDIMSVAAQVATVFIVVKSAIN